MGLMNRQHIYICLAACTSMHTGIPGQPAPEIDFAGRESVLGVGGLGQLLLRGLVLANLATSPVACPRWPDCLVASFLWGIQFTRWERTATMAGFLESRLRVYERTHYMY